MEKDEDLSFLPSGDSLLYARCALWSGLRPPSASVQQQFSRDLPPVEHPRCTWVPGLGDACWESRHMGLGHSTNRRATWTFFDLSSDLSAFCMVFSCIFLRWRRHRWRGHRSARPQPELQAEENQVNLWFAMGFEGNGGVSMCICIRYQSVSAAVENISTNFSC